MHHTAISSSVQSCIYLTHRADVKMLNRTEEGTCVEARAESRNTGILITRRKCRPNWALGVVADGAQAGSNGGKTAVTASDSAA
jgi:hypothetical protein